MQGLGALLPRLAVRLPRTSCPSERAAPRPWAGPGPLFSCPTGPCCSLWVWATAGTQGEGLITGDKAVQGTSAA